jgi:MFS transporter, PAT family, beta-lactamase induction signal transducer AmpG
VDESVIERGRSVHPALFFVLYFAFGAAGGFLSGAAENVYVTGGVSTAAFGAVLSIALAPQVAKVLWAPLVDTTLTPKIWYVIATVAVAAAIVIGASLPVRAASLSALTGVAIVVAVGASFLGMAADSLMAHATAPDRRGAAGGWSQAGNLGGAGVGVSVGLAIVSFTHSLQLAGIGVALICAVCALGLAFAPASHSLPRQASYLATLKTVVKDCWEVCRARLGWLTLFLFVLPLGAGGASNLSTGIAHEWRVDAGLLAGIALGGAVATGLGSIVGGYVCDRIDRRAAYALFGVLGGVTAAVAALAPKTPAWFVVFALGYAAALGMAYAAYAAANLEAIGRGAAATKYTLFASVANIPVTLMPLADGWADTHGGVNAMLWLELGVAVVAAALFAVVALASRPRPALAPA